MKYQNEFKSGYTPDQENRQSGTNRLITALIAVLAVAISFMGGIMFMMGHNNKEKPAGNEPVNAENPNLPVTSPSAAFSGEESEPASSTAAAEMTTTTATPETTLPVTEPAFQPYLISIKHPYLHIYAAPAYSADIVGNITDNGTYTIVEEHYDYASGDTFGKLKSGAGWISIQAAQYDFSGGIADDGRGPDEYSREVPYLLKLESPCVYIYSGPDLSCEIVGTITDKGTYTIVEERSNPNGVTFGKLKSGAGWIYVR